MTHLVEMWKISGSDFLSEKFADFGLFEFSMKKFQKVGTWNIREFENYNSI
jgi:hypothetical protein